MKIKDLVLLAEAAELALPQLEKTEVTKAAIEAAFSEARKRLDARKTARSSRPARSLRHESILKQLLRDYYKVRLTRRGEWHVQESAGSPWMLFALSDNEAEDLISQPARRQACGCRFKHSDAAGVIDACLLGQAQGEDEYWTGY